MKHVTGIVEIDHVISDLSWLLCPGCRGNNLHSISVSIHERDEDAVPTMRTLVARTTVMTELVESDALNPSSRRQGITIQFYCETCEATPMLRFAQHKGNTEVSWAYQG